MTSSSSAPGPAGLTAAIYTARASLAPLVIEGAPSSTTDQPGGQLMLTTEVENFPGFIDGIMGPELMANMRVAGRALRRRVPDHQGDPGRPLASQPLRVWATDPVDRGGARVRRPGPSSSRPAPGRLMLGLESERRLLGHGVSTCATCDGFFFRGHHIAVIGGGDSALEEANFLTKFGDTVTVVHRRKELRASKIMQERAFKQPQDRLHLGHQSSRSPRRQQGRGPGHPGRQDRRGVGLDVTGVFVAIGHAPNTSSSRARSTWRRTATSRPCRVRR